MKIRWILACAAAFAFAGVAGTASAAAIPSTTAQKCSDQIQNNTLKYVNSVQKQIRLSIKNNIKGKSSLCANKDNACAGGTNNLGKCNPANGNGDCPGGQCHPDTRKGISGKINKAKSNLRKKYAQFCTPADITALGFPNARCPDAVDATTLADCVLVGVVGDTDTAVFGDTAAEIMGRAATTIVPDNPSGVCALTFSSALSIGSASTSVTLAEAGGVAPANVVACVGPVCATAGAGIIGNNLTPPTQTFAGAIPVCLVTVTEDAGNGAPSDGEIDIATGEQTSFAPISSTVLIGTTCPVCTAGVCDSGASMGLPCTSPNGTDIACPPTIIGVPPVIPNPLDLTSEGVSISVPANNPVGGVTNPSGTFCGACDFDDTVGCNNDLGCVDAGACSGAVGSGCCQFGTNTGAFGDPSATTAGAPGVRGPYVARLGTVFCTGVSGDGLVDSTQGLPGPVRLVQQQLNAFIYP